jgi:hypothetical protein
MPRLLLPFSLTALSLLGAVQVISACGSEAAPTTEPTQPPPFVAADASAADSGNLVECDLDTRNPFLISEQNTLYLFDPVAGDLRSIGTVQCSTTGATPTSMAVDRFGIAWVRHNDGSLWKLNTKTLACTQSTYAPLTTEDPFYKFGMGFATSSKGVNTEQLYLSDNAGAGLGKLDLNSFKTFFVGPYKGALANKTCELTGTGDGRLFGFFVTKPAQIAEIAKNSGDTISTKELTGVDPGDAWAFSFYGGDFFVYTHAATDGGPSQGSDITRYRPSDGTITVVKPKIGFKIVGAGVSTCAPTEGPR